ncbi:MAG: hypothetical protein ACOX7I_01430 [Oscillospiraceae bacterium]|jgi:hypothetical protein
MKFFDKKFKVALLTFILMVLVMFEFAVLDGYYYTNATETGLTKTIKNLKKDLGYNFVTMSFVVYILSVAYSGFLGFRKNWAGLVALLLAAAFPFIGLFVGFKFFYGWGTSHLLPMLTVLKLHTASRGVQLLIFAIVFIIYAAIWFIFRYVRKKYDEKNPW